MSSVRSAMRADCSAGRRTGGGCSCHAWPVGAGDSGGSWSTSRPSTVLSRRGTGTCSRCPHFGHTVFLPTFLTGTVYSDWQLGQAKRIIAGLRTERSGKLMVFPESIPCGAAIQPNSLPNGTGERTTRHRGRRAASGLLEGPAFGRLGSKYDIVTWLEQLPSRIAASYNGRGERASSLFQFRGQHFIHSTGDGAGDLRIRDPAANGPGQPAGRVH